MSACSLLELFCPDFTLVALGFFWQSFMVIGYRAESSTSP